ncbi:uncharacterized protein LOC106661059 [Cimex lectularius]|uniref:MADF domain-containing protein n=1 Tax=Cimex lectularius TaxID=79782 RepID=A0A8I6R9F3_CIMLE|nr:uncharacterized protein LOC106661059 [Cimex lectularius]
MENMEWSEQLTLQLIEVYRTKEELWNTKHPNYYNKIKKNDAWNDLAGHFQTTANECKRKINNLLSGMRREKVKMKKTQGRSDVYESRWYAFKNLLFLWDKNNIEAQSTSNFESAGGYYEADGNKEQDDDWSGKCQFLWKEDTQDLNTTSFTTPANKIIKKEPNPLECVQQEGEGARRRTEVVYESSESEAFGKLVAAKHEKLTPTQRMYAESIIINTLNKALLQKLTENTALSDAT